MRIGTNGILIDEFGQVLLIRRNDTRTMAPPGGGVESGELPTDNIAREVREETGLIAMPIRLVGLYMWGMRPHGFLVFVFRCLRRGGVLTTSEESPQVGFFPSNPLPRSMVPVHRERLQRGLHHDGGAPHWAVQRFSLPHHIGAAVLGLVIYPYMNLRRKLRGEPAYIPPPEWDVSVYTVATDDEGRVIWTRPTEDESWRLPGGRTETMEPPWKTAERRVREQIGVRPRVTNLSGVYVRRGVTEMQLVFTAALEGSALELSESVRAAGRDDFPKSAPDHHVQWVKHACGGREMTQFNYL